MDDYYRDVMQRALSYDKTWADPHVTSFAARVFQTALLGEAIIAASTARAGTNVVSINEWATADTFEMSLNARTVRFERKGGDIIRRYQGFPSMIVPDDDRHATVAAPSDPGEAMKLARQLVGAALERMMRTA